MCGSSSALGLSDHERTLWPELRERLRVPGHAMAMMRAVLGDDVEVAVVVSVTPSSVTRPLAVLATPGIADEVEVLHDDGDRGRGRIGDDEVRLLMGSVDDGTRRPVAVLVDDWLRTHLSLYAREPWHRRRVTPSSTE